MRIILSAATLMHGGAERVITILANHLAQEGHDVTISLLYNREIWYDLNPLIKVVNDEETIGRANILKHVFYRKKLYRETKPDIILSFLAPVNIINILAAKLSKKKIIVADRNAPNRTPANCAVRVIRNILYIFADHIVIQSKINKSYFSKIIQKKSSIIYNPVDKNSIRDCVESGAKKEDVIVAVGRLIPQKNHKMLIDSFGEITGSFPSYRLIIYGEGNLKKELLDYVNEKGLMGKVSFPGAEKNIFPKMMEAKLYVMTSDFEGMPNSLIEAMCLGVPAISTKVSGATDLIIDGINGDLVDIGDVKMLTQKMLRLLSHPEIMNSYSIEAQKIMAKLDVNTIVAEWNACINEVLNNDI